MSYLYLKNAYVAPSLRKGFAVYTRQGNGKGWVQVAHNENRLVAFAFAQQLSDHDVVRFDTLARNARRPFPVKGTYRSDDPPNY